MSAAMMGSLVGMKYACLVSRSTITKIESHIRFEPGSIDGGNLTMESIVTLLHGRSGGASGCNRP